ncbi:MAG: Rnf-Nqr domain containing protein [Candidatus Rifleibacteriota bacterium]
MIELFFRSAISENMALYFFLGTCPLISISTDLRAAWQMGVTVTLVMISTMAVNWFTFYQVLRPAGLEYLQLLFFILTIAAVVQFLEIFLDRFFPAIYSSFGIFLPLIAVNCAILGVSMFAVLKELNFTESIVFASGAGTGWSLVLCLIASLRRRVAREDVPSELGNVGLTMVIAAVAAMAFSGLTGLEFSGG